MLLVLFNVVYDNIDHILCLRLTALRHTTGPNAVAAPLMIPFQRNGMLNFYWLN